MVAWTQSVELAAAPCNDRTTSDTSECLRPGSVTYVMGKLCVQYRRVSECSLDRSINGPRVGTGPMRKVRNLNRQSEGPSRQRSRRWRMRFIALRVIRQEKGVLREYLGR